MTFNALGATVQR